jgi:hypothetical protein
MLIRITNTNNQTILVNTDKIITVKPSESGDHHKTVIDLDNGKEILSLTPFEQIYRQTKYIGVQIVDKFGSDINPLKVCLQN